jgi:REP element-mobilizing transposase RayT
MDFQKNIYLRPLTNHFWSTGYCVDTVGMDSEMIRKYVKFQDKEHDALAGKITLRNELLK